MVSDNAIHLFLSNSVSGAFHAPALLKIVIFFGVWLALWLPLAIPVAIAVKWRPLTPITVSQKLPLVASLYLIAPLVIWAANIAWGGSFSAYGLSVQPSFLRSLGLGLAIGVLGLGVMFAVQASFGWLTIGTAKSEQSEPPPPAWGSTVISTLLLGLWVSLTEELIFRGFLVNQLQQDYALWVAAAIASLIFAVLHLVWEGLDNLPQLPGLWLMGMVLVLARWLDGGQLGLAIGLHAGWIWAIASLDTLDLVTYTGKAPEVITGLGRQPLAGVMGILFLLGSGVTIWGIWSSIG